MKSARWRITPGTVTLLLAGSAIQAFGLANIHAFSQVTEGGVLGATLLLQHWLNISPAVTSFVLNALCYVLGWRTLGMRFVVCSVIASGGFSLFYALIEPFAPLIPWLISSPVIAAVSGAVFVGVGAGLSVRAGGAASGDDALAMSLSRRTGVPIERFYLITDLTVLALSVTYIPVSRIVWSLLTVILSGQIIGWIQKINVKETQDETDRS